MVFKLVLKAKSRDAGLSFARPDVNETPDFEYLLQEGIRAGQFGGDIESHGAHAMGFTLFDDVATPLVGHVIDLGSGAGLPALVLATVCEESNWLLIERRTSRAELLVRAVRRLGLEGRVKVIADDAGTVAWGENRASADWVTARSFGSPASTAEVAAPLLRPGGSLLVSEPRDTKVSERWPEKEVRKCGLELAREWTSEFGRYLRFARLDSLVDGLPRKGARKRPIF